MAGENTVATLDGLFKKVFSDKLGDLIPDFAILQKKIEWVAAEKELGAFYAQPVALSAEAGFSYLGTAGGVTALQAAANGVMKEAQIYGSELVLRSQLSYASLSRAAKSGEGAFKRASAFKVMDMNDSMRKRLEISMLYGQNGVGTVESATDLTGGVCEIVITAATWAGGIWAGAEGARLDAFTTTTKNNASGVLTITKVDSDNRKLTCTFTGTLATEVAAADVLYFQSTNSGSSVFNEMAGLQKIISNTGSLFGIDASVYSLWKGTTVSSVGQLAFAKIQTGIARAVNKGLMGKVAVLLSPAGWSSLNSDQAALRVFDNSYGSSKAENGAESLMFHGVNGAIELISHPLVKDGDAFIVPLDTVQRVGSLDLSFQVPGMDGEKFFRLVSDYNAVELQCMADQAIFLEKPSQAVYLSGITYT